MKIPTEAGKLMVLFALDIFKCVITEFSKMLMGEIELFFPTPANPFPALSPACGCGRRPLLKGCLRGRG